MMKTSSSSAPIVVSPNGSPAVPAKAMRQQQQSSGAHHPPLQPVRMVSHEATQRQQQEQQQHVRVGAAPGDGLSSLAYSMTHQPVSAYPQQYQYYQQQQQQQQPSMMMMMTTHPMLVSSPSMPQHPYYHHHYPRALFAAAASLSLQQPPHTGVQTAAPLTTLAAAAAAAAGVPGDQQVAVVHSPIHHDHQTTTPYVKTTTATSPVPSMIPRPPPPQKKHRYLVVTLERPSLETSWGLSITLLENRFLVVGHVADAAHSNNSEPNTSTNGDSNSVPRNPPRVRTACVTDSPAAPTPFWTAASVNVPLFVRQLLREQEPVAVHHNAALSSVLRPGDCLVAVAGRSCRSQLLAKGEGGFSAITASLRERTWVSLVLYRDPQATSAAVSDAARVQAAYGALRASVPHTPPPLPRKKPASLVTQHRYTIPRPKNPLFVDPVTGKQGIEYYDEGFEYDPDEGRRSSLFLPPVTDFADWLARRKQTWRQHYYTVSTISEDWVQEERVTRKKAKHFPRNGGDEESSADSTFVAVDFWSAPGRQTHYSSLAHWLAARTAEWKKSYSWNRRKRQRIEHDCEEVVHLSSSSPESFGEWLRVRKNQWKVQRRKRLRQQQQQQQAGGARRVLLEEESSQQQQHTLTTLESESTVNEGGGVESREPHQQLDVLASTLSPTTTTAVVAHHNLQHQQQSPELMVIDALLEEQEREQNALLASRQQAIDISFLFDATLGCPDDTVARIFSFLSPMEHGKFLCINWETRRKLMERDKVWRQLCPPHWQLPRRPRKPWHTLYRTKLRAETELARKKWDDLLSKASNILLKADQVQSIEKLVTGAERSCNFRIDYVSGVVCECNSLLNLAVIHQRHSTLLYFSSR